MVVENCIAVIIKSPGKLVGITIQLSREIQLSIISGSILVPLDVSKRRWESVFCMQEVNLFGQVEFCPMCRVGIWLGVTLL